MACSTLSPDEPKAAANFSTGSGTPCTVRNGRGLNWCNFWSSSRCLYAMESEACGSLYWLGSPIKSGSAKTGLVTGRGTELTIGPEETGWDAGAEAGLTVARLLACLLPAEGDLRLVMRYS